MKFSELAVGDMFNTKTARYVKIAEDKAMVVMKGMYPLGVEHTIAGNLDVIVLYSANRYQIET